MSLEEQECIQYIIYDQLLCQCVNGIGVLASSNTQLSVGSRCRPSAADRSNNDKAIAATVMIAVNGDCCVIQADCDVIVSDSRGLPGSRRGSPAEQ